MKTLGVRVLNLSCGNIDHTHKFIYSEKAKKYDEIFFLLYYVISNEIWRFRQTLVAFWENIKLKYMALTFPTHINEDLSSQFTHIHSGNHLFKSLLAWIQRTAIHGIIPFGTDKVELVVITKGAENWKFVLHTHSNIKTVHHMVSLFPNLLNPSFF